MLLVPLDNSKKKEKEVKQDYLKYPECDLILKDINRRYAKGLGTNIFIVGLSGTGKSSTSQRIAEVTNKSRDDKNEIYIVDSLLGFVKAVRNSKQGDFIVIEEVSVLFPSRRAMARENVGIGKIFDTIRKKRLCVISNAPIWQSIDSHMRALGHIIIETLSIRKKEEIVISKFHRLQTAPSTGKTYKHTYQREGRDVLLMYTKMPNQERWDKYEKQKDAFMDEIYQSLENEQNLKKKKQLKQMGVKPKVLKLTRFEAEIDYLFNHEKLNKSQIAGKLDKDPSQITRAIQNINKKKHFSKEKEGS